MNAGDRLAGIFFHRRAVPFRVRAIAHTCGKPSRMKTLAKRTYARRVTATTHWCLKLAAWRICTDRWCLWNTRMTYDEGDQRPPIPQTLFYKNPATLKALSPQFTPTHQITREIWLLNFQQIKTLFDAKRMPMP